MINLAELEQIAREEFANGIAANGDIFASAEYRTHLVQVYTKRALTRAVERAKGQTARP